MAIPFSQLIPVLLCSTVGLAWYICTSYRKHTPYKLSATACGRDACHEQCEAKLQSGGNITYFPLDTRNDGGAVEVQVETAILPAKPGMGEDRVAMTFIAAADLPLLKGREGFSQSWNEVVHRGKASPEWPVDRLMMFSVIDGHGSDRMAELLSKVVHPTLAYALAEHGDGIAEKAKLIADTLLALDNDILRLPVTLLHDHLPDSDLSSLLPSPSPAWSYVAELEYSGACLTNVIIDQAEDKMYISNIGDCRAIAGWKHPHGKWRYEVLSEIGDGNAFNAVEVQRIRGEHPQSEADDVICDLGNSPRVLGNGQPTRAFGDRQCKAPQAELDEISKHLGVSYYPNQKPYLTPPYLTAEPESLVRNLYPDSGEILKYIILASDGLWDLISSEEAGLLISAHLEESHQGAVPKSVLPKSIPLIPATGPRPYPAEALPGTAPENSKGIWTFQDDNAAVHLLRNALGRGDPWERRRLLSMQDGMVKSFRDDITAQVIFFGVK